jgi:hypothetical protein
MPSYSQNVLRFLKQFGDGNIVKPRFIVFAGVHKNRSIRDDDRGDIGAQKLNNGSGKTYMGTIDQSFTMYVCIYMWLFYRVINSLINIFFRYNNNN